MYIARLQLKGFKSFGLTHELNLSPGFVAIVGPNGSGKSNLLDALRWTLGDSNAGRLRISRQSDLLFQGSISNQAVKEGEASLQLRDELQVCTIRRRVSADGSTSILVDGQKVTHAQLEESKRRFRLEGDRFAFIGQGEVAEVIQQRPAARRLQLEVLFGIDLYRKRRSEAADRLKEAQQEYQHLRAFSAELSGRREEIAPMVARAAEARELLDELEEWRRDLYWVRRYRTEEAITRFDDLHLVLSHGGELRRFWHRAWALAKDRMDETAGAAAADLDEIRIQHDTLRLYFDEQRRKAFTLGSTLYEAKKSDTSIDAEMAELETNGALMAAEVRTKETELGALSNESATRRAELLGIEEMYSSQVAKRQEAKTAHEEMLRRKGTLDAEAESSRAYLRSLGTRWLSTMNDMAARSERVEAAESELALCRAVETESRAHLDVCAQEHASAYALCQETALAMQALRRETSAMRSKIDEWMETLEQHIYPAPVRHLMSAARLGKLEASPVPVVDAFKCPPQYAEAFEAYLGGRQFWMLVETMDEAGRCIDMLKSRQAGRATMLPLDRVRPRNPDRRSAQGASGVVGFALDLIEPAPHWLPALSHIMGDVLFVTAYSNGQTLVRSGFRYPIVTLEGDVFQTSGAISGGRNQRQKSGQTFELKSRIDEQKDALDASEAKLAVLTSKMGQYEARERTSIGARDAAAQAAKNASSEVGAKSEALSSLSDAQFRAQALMDELAALLKKEGLARTQAVQERAALREMSVRFEDTPLDDSHIERARAASELAAERVNSASSILERIKQELYRLVKRTESLTASRDANRTRIRSARSQLSALGQDWLVQRRIYTATAYRMKDMAEKFSATESRTARCAARYSTSGEALRALEMELTKCVQDMGAAKREHEELVATWEEQHPYPDEFIPKSDPEELRRRVRELERAVKALGDVDIGVLSEDRNLKDRLSFLGEQLDDVRATMGELEKLIQDADKQAQTVFSKALSEIDERFDQLFRRLFGGGEAHLEMLAAAENQWDAGVEVMARPPGKRPQGITQLSGGEQSLSAIALLFASMEVAGCPLAVLDEVDAALDEVNLRRFADLVREYASARQILVMTHRRVTMERADVLYGVTLSEPGLSQVVGVRLEDWA